MFPLLFELSLVYIHVPFECLQDGDKVLQHGHGTGISLVFKAGHVGFEASIILVVVLDMSLEIDFIFFVAIAHGIPSTRFIPVILCE